MTTLDRHHKIDQSILWIQSTAFQWTNNMDTARNLYIETVYQAKKSIHTLSPEMDFEKWLLSIMQRISVRH